MNAPTIREMGPLEWLLLLTLSILWGGSFFFVEVIVGTLPPLTIVVLRVGLAALALNLVLIVLGRRLPWDGGVWRAFAAMGCLNNLIPFCLIVWGQTHIASGLASILNATTPMFTVLVAHWLTADEKMTRGKIFGVVVGFLGVVVIFGATALHALGADPAAQLAVLAAALSYAFAGIYGRRFRRTGMMPMQAAAGQLTAATILLLPVAMAVERPWTIAPPDIATWAAVAGLALLSTALAYILYFRILAAAGATNLLLVTFLIPVSAVSLGATILGEELTAAHFVGMALIGVGLAAIDGRVLTLCRPAARNVR